MARLRQANGVVIYAGASALDGSPIVCVATGLAVGSANGKTGRMIQTWIVRSDMNPLAAADSGADGSVCGDCKHRGVVVDGHNRERSCYVQLGQAVLNVYRSYHRGIYPTEWDSGRFAGRVVRMGSYGDPAAVPYHVWAEVLREASGHTGYTHQWRSYPEMAEWVMASCDTADERAAAKLLGFRTFRVSLEIEHVLPSEVRCPASAEAGKKTVCAACRACGGNAAKAKADILIAVHPASHKKSFARALQRAAA